MKLIDEMKKHLPITAYPTKALRAFFRSNGKPLNKNAEFQITHICDSGDDFGGIVCAIENENKEVVLASLTHLRIKPEHPLSDKIASYQTQRVEMLSRM